MISINKIWNKNDLSSNLCRDFIFRYLCIYLLFNYILFSKELEKLD